MYSQNKSVSARVWRERDLSAIQAILQPLNEMRIVRAFLET